MRGGWSSCEAEVGGAADHVRKLTGSQKHIKWTPLGPCDGQLSRDAPRQLVGDQNTLNEPIL